jgi:predicted transcriptional regulator
MTKRDPPSMHCETFAAMYRFHVIVQAADAEGRPVTFWELSFEQAAQRLSRLPRMDVEPDGALLWAGTDESGERWQVEGTLMDGGAALAYVELKGSCPPAAWDELLRALGWPGQRLVYQLPQDGRWLSESQFRAHAARAPAT